MSPHPLCSSPYGLGSAASMARHAATVSALTHSAMAAVFVDDPASLALLGVPAWKKFHVAGLFPHVGERVPRRVVGDWGPGLGGDGEPASY